MVSYLDVTWGKFQNIEAGGKRPLRLALEGRLKIPAMPFSVGFDANLGSGGRDDLRFLIDSGFNIGDLFKKVLNAK